MNHAGLVILDRDGVLNRMVINQDHGTVDSPLHENQVEVFPWVPESLQKLTEMGFQLAIATNQPAAAKAKTTLENLEKAHKKVIKLSEEAGAKISHSEICFHRSEDNCSCRKPKPAMLERIIDRFPSIEKTAIWMVGDGVTDIQAGKAVGIKTAFVGPQKCDHCRIFHEANLRPDFIVSNLKEFVEKVAKDLNVS